MKVAVLTGGVGGAKLVGGLRQALAPGMLTAIVNTGDDFTHLGLHVSPDIDTLLYTLAGLSDEERGWGRRDESWNFMAALGELGSAGSAGHGVEHGVEHGRWAGHHGRGDLDEDGRGASFPR